MIIMAHLKNDRTNRETKVEGARQEAGAVRCGRAPLVLRQARAAGSGVVLIEIKALFGRKPCTR
jgi:hypothetical protein